MLSDAPFLRACRGERPAHRPVWFMRQAGRSLPEFRAIREKWSFFETIHQPDLAAEITLQPVRRLGVDAAIFFSDIVTPLEAIAVGVDIKAGVGPVFDQPFRTAADLARLRPLEAETDLAHVVEAVRIAVAELTPKGIPLIGFAGAPFTVASYFVEGGPSRDYVRTKGLMHGDPELWRSLCDALADLALASLRAQVGAGAQAVQVFDSWAGALTREEYRTHVLPSTARIFSGLADLGVPRIHFGVGTGELLDLFHDAGADVVGVDWRVQLDDAARRIPDVVLQGNLDPAVVAGAPDDVVACRVDDVLDRADAAALPGHVFNLGHGVLPETDPDALARVVDRVHDRPLP